MNEFLKSGTQSGPNRNKTMQLQMYDLSLVKIWPRSRRDRGNLAEIGEISAR